MDKQDWVISMMRSDNRKTFREFFDYFYPVLCAFASKYLGDRPASEDVVQDVLLKYWENRRRFSRMDEAKRFLYTAVRNRCVNIRKKAEVGERYALLERQYTFESFEEDIFEYEVLSLLRNAVGDLPGQMKRIIEYSLGGMGTADIAREMSIAEGTLRTLKKIAYRKLREAMKSLFSLFL